MWRRFSLFLAMTTAFILIFPSVYFGTEAEGTGDQEPPTRYGFTLDWDTVAQPASMAYCVATGDVDGANNDDIAVGYQGSIVVYTNNGVSGSQVSFGLETTIPLAGYYITDLEITDYDDDGDNDIIALGQSDYLFTNTIQSEDGPYMGSAKVFYIENGQSGFTLETSDTFSDVIYYISHWYFFDGKLDLATGDFDKDGDVDSVLLYADDNDGNVNTAAEGLRLMGVYYESGVLSNQSLAFHPHANSITWGHVRTKDIDENGYIDVIYTECGFANDISGLDVQVLLNTAGGFQSTQNAVNIPAQTNLGKYSYSMAIGHFSGPMYLDIAVAVNYNAGGSTYGKDGKIRIVKQKSDNTFQLETAGKPFAENKHFQHRGMAAGHLNDDSETGEDLICFTKFDTNDDLTIDDFGVSYIRGKISFPPGFKLGKVYDTETGNLDTEDIRGIALGDFDNDDDGFDDVVFVGSDIQVGLVFFPPNNPPEKVSVSMSPSPVLNNNDQTAVINLTIRDEDGNWDLDKIVVDFSSIGLGEKTIDKPTYRNSTKPKIGFYEFTMNVPPTVSEGDYEIPFEMYDTSDNGREPKSNDTFMFRVKQYNRNPEIVLVNKTFVGKEDQVMYIEGLYDWFNDDDGDELEIKMLNPSGVSVPMVSNYIFTATMVNGSEENPQEWALKIEPEENEHHRPFDSGNVLRFKADDGVLESDILEIMVKIESVNDPPIIPPQGKPDADFEYMLEQDDPAVVHLRASDPADGDPGGDYLSYYFEYDDPDDSEWLQCSEDGVMNWNPKNEHVGSHKVTLWVNDSEANVSQVLWFNVSNVIDKPYFISLSYMNQTYEDIPKSPGEMVFDFTVNEHEEFNLTIVAGDADMEIGMQDEIDFKCNLTLGNNAFLDVDPDDPTRAYFHFMAEKKFGFPATVGNREPLETEILLTDQMDPEIIISANIRINIKNINDPPRNVSIDTPDDGEVFQFLYRHKFSAGTVLDPDLAYGDNITYQWDFDQSDGFQVEAEGATVIHDFDQAGDYVVTLRVIDSGNNSASATVRITVNGEKNETDWDNDGMPNEWEDRHSFDKLDPSDALVDSDDDGWTNLQEYLNQTDPFDSDSDGDGVEDSVDIEPNNPLVWEYREKQEDDSIWPMIIIIAVVILIIILLFITILYVITSRKRAQEEEEKRKKAEEMAASLYEDQDIYSDLPQLKEETPEAKQLPSQEEAPTLPEKPEEEMGDVFEGAGVLPSEESEEGSTPPPKKGEEETEVSDDLSDLFD